MRGPVVSVSLAGNEALLVRASARGQSLRVEAVESMALPGDLSSRREARRRLTERGFLGLPTTLVLSAGRAFLCFHRPGVRDEKAVRQTIRYEVEREIPVPVTGTVSDFDFLSGELGSGRRVVFAAVSEDDVNAQVAALEQIGLRPSQATLESAALCNAYANLGVRKGNGQLLAIHFSPESVSVIRVGRDGLEDMRGIALNGEEGAVAREVPQLLRSTLLAANLAGDVERLYVSGPPAERPSVVAQLQRYAGVRLLSPELEGLGLDGLSGEEVGVLHKKGLPLIGAACEALGLRCMVSMNLLDTRRQLPGLDTVLRRPLRVAAVLLIALLLAWSSEGLLGAARVRAARLEARAELAELWHEFHAGAPLPLDPARAIRSELAAHREGGRETPQGRLGVLRVLRRVAGPLTASRGDPPYSARLIR